MLNTRLAVARTVTAGLVDIEKQIDSGLVMHGRLLGELIEGRRAAHLPLNAGEEGLDHFHEAAAHLMAARKAMAKAHYAFRDVRDQLGLPVHAYGDQGDTPEDTKRAMGASSATPALSVVSAAA